MSEIKRDYYDNGQLKSETPYQNGQRHGVEKWWYRNGQLYCRISHKNDQYHGVVKYWYENGQFDCERYLLYDNQVTKEEYRKHILVENLAGLK